MLFAVTGAPRRILMTADAVGGIWSYASDLSAALRGRGHAVTLAVLGPGLDAPRRAEARDADLAVVETGVRPEWLAADEAEVAAAGRKIAALARRAKADLVHLNHPALLAATAFPAPVLAVCHSCVATWWAAVHGGPLPGDLRWRAALTERGLAKAQAMIAPTRAFAEATRRAYGFGVAPTVVPNGIAAAVPDDDAGPLAPYAFTAGRLWDEGKNIAALDRAAARIPVRTIAAGPLSGPNGAASALHNIRPVGSLGRAALLARLRERPIYVSPALYEPFGLAVLEAARAGCALVLSGIASFRELWEGAAVFVPPHDDRAIAAAVVGLLGDKALRLRLGAGARDRAGAFTVAAMADGTERAYAGVLAAADGTIAAA